MTIRLRSKIIEGLERREDEVKMDVKTKLLPRTAANINRTFMKRLKMTTVELEVSEYFLSVDSFMFKPESDSSMKEIAWRQ